MDGELHELGDDVDLVGQGSHAGCLGGSGHHEALVLADLPEVRDQVGIACVEADPQAGQVRPLGQGVDRQHPLGTVLEDRPARAIPGELHVALVGDHGNPVLPAPCGRGAQVVESPGRVARRVHPEDEGTIGIGRVDRRQVDAPGVVHGNGHGPAAGQLGAHGIRRVRQRRVEHGVAVGVPQPQELGQAHDQLLRANAHTHVGRVHVYVQSALHPGGHGPTQLGAALRGRIRPGRAGFGECGHHHVGDRITR